MPTCAARFEINFAASLNGPPLRAATTGKAAGCDCARTPRCAAFARRFAGVCSAGGGLNAALPPSFFSSPLAGAINCESANRGLWFLSNWRKTFRLRSMSCRAQWRNPVAIRMIAQRDSSTGLGSGRNDKPFSAGWFFGKRLGCETAAYPRDAGVAAQVAAATLSRDSRTSRRAATSRASSRLPSLERRAGPAGAPRRAAASLRALERRRCPTTCRHSRADLSRRRSSLR